MSEELGGSWSVAAALRGWVESCRFGFMKTTRGCCISRQQRNMRLAAIVGHVLGEKAMLT